GRKYRIRFTLAHQYLAQLDQPTAAAILGNVGNVVAFGVGRDAEELAEMLGSPVQPEDLRLLPKYHAYVRMLIDGVPAPPFSMLTPPPKTVSPDKGRVDTIRRLTRQRYGRPRSTVEDEIAAFHR